MAISLAPLYLRGMFASCADYVLFKPPEIYGEILLKTAFCMQKAYLCSS